MDVAGPVDVVVFSDFECPFCKNAARMIKELASLEGTKVRFLFRHLPLRMHPWARPAAEATACAQFQGDTAFWKLHDLIFENQGTINAENVMSRIVEFGGTIPELDVSKLQACISSKAGAATVSDDMRFASANGISGTPTFFVNGHRLQGVRNLEQLLAVIRERTPAPVRTHGQQ